MFRLAATPASPSGGGGAPLNTSDEPSRLIDVGQWVTLFRLLMEDADADTDKVRSRNSRIQAGQCLTEALKFYDEPENELPPPEAFFSEESRRRFADAPQTFSRSRLIELIARLPRA